MDQDAFRETYRDVNDRICVFEKAILTNQCRCSLSDRLCIAEREGVHCRSEAAHGQCRHLLETLRREARFAVKSQETEGVLAHGKAMRIQIGGLRGLHGLLFPDTPIPTPLPDIHRLVAETEERFGTFEKMPFQTVIQQIAAYRPRRRGRRRR